MNKVRDAKTLEENKINFNKKERET